jgi:hypothetical protein
MPLVTEVSTQIDDLHLGLVALSELVHQLKTSGARCHHAARSAANTHANFSVRAIGIIVGNDQEDAAVLGDSRAYGLADRFELLCTRCSEHRCLGPEHLRDECVG